MVRFISIRGWGVLPTYALGPNVYGEQNEKMHLGRSLRANIPISLFAQLWERLEVGSELGQNPGKT
jgi:hypothetical protein